MKIWELDQPRVGDIVEFETDPETVVEGLIVGETDDGYIYEFSESGYTELNEACTYGKYYCSTDKKYKCRQSPKQSRDVAESVDFAQMQPQQIVSVAQQAFARLYPGVKLYGKSVVEGVGLTTQKGREGTASAFAGGNSERGEFYLTLNAYAESGTMIVVIEDATAGEYKGATSAIIKALFEGGERLYKTEQRELAVKDNANYDAWSTIADRVGAELTESTDVAEEKQRLDPKCWDGYKKQGTKMKGGVRVNNCVPESAGYIAKNSAEARDPRFSSSMTVDVGTDTMRKQLDAFFPTEAPADGQQQIREATYQGREVPLGRPMRGDVKKFKVYVKDPKTGNVKKVNFGDPNMRIKKSNPKRRKSFRARHNCKNPGPRTKARYWSCRKW